MYTGNLHHIKDEELLHQLSMGSKTAFDALYERYWKQVYNTAYKRLNNAEYAQDIAQDVFVQLWIRGTKAPIDNLPAYLTVAARNGVFKHMEKQSKYADMPDAPIHLESPLESADASVLFREFHASFHKLVDSLPAQQRIIFKMRFEEDLSSQQIADILNISPKTVRNQIGKALATIKTYLLIIEILLYFLPRG